ncbi:unannotated protein [freshwater metagenome]|uniref:Unannotated protein n=1 Tax=freshwater metagenome TaxID=449393 RepID=A0A6J7I1E0_9ZZZZ|nr:hypothetical protein [Actinomycetota bacterium]MSW62956.1 hypothetical protein [Actinomycetota bacterium]MSX90047.1 hypothetical protein [Actinomycetota bacterium]MSZ63905.1 hypothetical protein [Actinomycetota bacterium]MTA57848.1 hypothetical protein [Actinomycetota bacterium]
MGLFGKAVDARTSQVLRNELGFDVEFDFVAGGVFKCDPLGFSIKPFMAAVGSDGIFFIHEGRVALALPWSGILSRKPDIWGKGSELQIAIPRVSKYTQPSEFPFCYWHKAEISFNKPEDHEKFLQMYFDSKFNDGFTKESLVLHDEWMRAGIKLPVSEENYMKANQGWGTEESRLDSYRIWGLTQDSLRFLYFVGRSVCRGILPGILIQRAFNLWSETEKLSSKYTGQVMSFGEEFMNLKERTEELTLFRGDPDLWAIGRIEVGVDEWKSEIPTFERLAAFDLQDISGEWTVVPVWSDFHDGSDLVITSVLKELKDESLHLITGKGLVTISNDERPKFSELIKKLT